MYHCVQLSYTIQHRTVLIIIPPNLQTSHHCSDAAYVGRKGPHQRSVRAMSVCASCLSLKLSHFDNVTVLFELLVREKYVLSKLYVVDDAGDKLFYCKWYADMDHLAPRVRCSSSRPMLSKFSNVARSFRISPSVQQFAPRCDNRKKHATTLHHHINPAPHVSSVPCNEGLAGNQKKPVTTATAVTRTGAHTPPMWRETQDWKITDFEVWQGRVRWRWQTAKTQ